MKIYFAIVVFIISLSMNAQKKWTSWRYVHCGNGLMMKYGKGEYNEYAKKWKYFIRYKNPTSKTISFSYGGGDFINKGKIKTTQRMTLSPGEEKGSWFLIKSGSSVWFPVDRKKFEGAKRYIDCSGNEIISDAEKRKIADEKRRKTEEARRVESERLRKQQLEKERLKKEQLIKERLERELLEKKRQQSEKQRIEQQLEKKRLANIENTRRQTQKNKTLYNTNNNSTNNESKRSINNYESINVSNKTLPRPKTNAEIHREHVLKNNQAYAKRKAEKDRINEQRLIEYNRKQAEIQRNLQLKNQRIKADFDRKQALRLAEFKRSTEKIRQDKIAIDNASEKTMTQWANGNYIAGSTALVSEYASQGNKVGAYGTLAIGVGMQIASQIRENKLRNERIEAERQERLRREREIKRKKETLLKEQKERFYELVDQYRKEKKAIIRKRESFYKNSLTLTSLSKKTANNNEPMYFFVVTSNKINSYSEKINFPNTIEIIISNEVLAEISPILVVHPFSNSEYPLMTEVKEWVSQKLSNQFLDAKNIKYSKWCNQIEGIQQLYKKEVEQATNNHLKVKFGKTSFIHLNEKDRSTEENNYWVNPDMFAKDKSNDSTEVKEIDYWVTPEKDLNQEILINVKNK